MAIATVVGGGRRLLAGRRGLEDRDRCALQRPEVRRLAGLGNITYHAFGLIRTALSKKISIFSQALQKWS